MLDPISLLIAMGFSTACIAATMIAAWNTARDDGFLLTCGLGALLVAISLCGSTLYAMNPSAALGTLTYALLLTGIAMLYGTALQFRYDVMPRRQVLIASLLAMAMSLPGHISGYNAVGFAGGFIAATVLILLTSYHFWRARSEAPGTVTAIATLYLLIAVSFGMRAYMVIAQGDLVIDGPPRNWAQSVGLVLIIAATPGIGSLTMILNQKRLVRLHRREALTDPLTGLMNRRALFDRFNGPLQQPITAALFDIDHFKNINDTQGHAVGDRIIALFAQSLKENRAPGHIAARLGGEEFVLIRPAGSTEAVLKQAERVRARFAELAFRHEGLSCTASGGLATGQAENDTLDTVLAIADAGLYTAKRSGRDRMASPPSA